MIPGLPPPMVESGSSQPAATRPTAARLNPAPLPAAFQRFAPPKTPAAEAAVPQAPVGQTSAISPQIADEAAMPKDLQFQETPEILAFDSLNICRTPEQKVTLNALISQLQVKNPRMLAGILNNCQWLKGKAQDDFIYSVAVASMQMELADVFDQAGFDALPSGIQPTPMVMLGTEAPHMIPLLNNASIEVLKKTRKNFSNMLNGIPKPPEVESFYKRTTNDGMNSEAWYRWEMGHAVGGLYAVRSCVSSDILPQSRASQENPQPPDMQERAVVSHFLPLEYAYSQLLFRHTTLPGQEEGPPPTFLAIRKVDALAYERITGETIEEGAPSEARNLTYSAEKALPAESWSIVSAVGGPDPIYGDSAIYGRVPAYSVLTSVFSQQWCPGQKELVVVPFSDISITAEAQLNEPEYEERVAMPAMERQYGKDHPSVIRAQKKLAGEFFW